LNEKRKKGGSQGGNLKASKSQDREEYERRKRDLQRGGKVIGSSYHLRTEERRKNRTNSMGGSANCDKGQHVKETTRKTHSCKGGKRKRKAGRTKEKNGKRSLKEEGEQNQ